MSTALTYATRNALADKPALSAVALSKIVYTPGKPEFSSLASSILGNVGTPGDGFDAIWNGVASILAPDVKALSVLDGILGTLGFVSGAVDAALFAPLAHDYGVFINSVDGSGAGAPPPPPPPPPIGGGDGHGGASGCIGGGGRGQGDPFDGYKRSKLQEPRICPG